MLNVGSILLFECFDSGEMEVFFAYGLNVVEGELLGDSGEVTLV